MYIYRGINRPFGYEIVYLSLCKVLDTLCHIQGDELYIIIISESMIIIGHVCQHVRLQSYENCW